jgi:tetratricopeptide (TPR) repeat protein
MKRGKSPDRLACAIHLCGLLLLLLPGISRAQTKDTAASPSSAPTPETIRRPLKPEAQQSWDRAQELLFRKHDSEASIAEFKKVLKIDPWYGPAYFLVGFAYMQLQRWGDAQWAFEEATKVEPGNAEAFLGLGSALNEQHDYTAAEKALEHSLELKPDSAEAHYELARSLGASGRWKAAEPHAQQAITLNPDYAGPHALMGNVYLDQKDPQSALREFREYLRLAPEGSLAESVKQIVAEIEKATATKAGHR